MNACSAQSAALRSDAPVPNRALSFPIESSGSVSSAPKREANHAGANQPCIRLLGRIGELAFAERSERRPKVAELPTDPVGLPAVPRGYGR